MLVLWMSQAGELCSGESLKYEIHRLGKIRDHCMGLVRVALTWPVRTMRSSIANAILAANALGTFGAFGKR